MLSQKHISKAIGVLLTLKTNFVYHVFKCCIRSLFVIPRIYCKSFEWKIYQCFFRIEASSLYTILNSKMFSEYIFRLFCMSVRTYYQYILILFLRVVNFNKKKKNLIKNSIFILYTTLQFETYSWNFILTKCISLNRVWLYIVTY